MFSTIVHPTDLSEDCIPALKTAHELARTLRARLLICYIAHPPLVASGNELTNPETNETRDILAEVRALQPLDPAVNWDVKVVLTDGNVSAKSLLSMLEGMGSDLLVLGMHKRKGISGWMAGSITEEVVRRAKCAVMVVKEHSEPSGEPAPEAE